MYPISNTVLALFQSGAMQYARLTIGSSTIANDRIKQGTFSINRYVETNESVAIGSCVAAEMVLVLDNYDGTYDNTDFVGSEAYVEIGVEDANHTIQYIPQGYFTFDEATRTKNTVSLAALDRMTKFDIVVNASQLSFPYTLTNLLDRICTLCGVTKGTFTLTNASYSVASLPSEAKTYRDLLRWICEVSGSNAYISYDGKLYLGWYGTTSQFNILPSNRTSSDLDKNTFSITGVTILTGDNQKYTAGTNTRPITITNNPFITTTQAQSVATTLNTKLGGFSYCPFTAVMLPSPMIFPMDRATFTTAEGTSVAVSVSEVTYKLNGNTAIACKGEMQVRGRSYGLADQTFYASNIAAGAVTADKISAGAVTADKINVQDLSALNATIGGWNINTNSLNKQTVASGTTYNAGLYAPNTATASSYAVQAQRSSSTETANVGIGYDGRFHANRVDTDAGRTEKLEIDGNEIYAEQTFHDYVDTDTDRKETTILNGSHLYLQDSKNGSGSYASYEAALWGSPTNATMRLDNYSAGGTDDTYVRATAETQNAEVEVWRNGTSAVLSYNDLTFNGETVKRNPNIAIGTSQMKTSQVYNMWRASGGTVSTVTNTNSEVRVPNAIRITNTGSSATQCGCAQDNVTGFVVGKKYTMSCWVRASVAGLSITLQPLWASSSQHAGAGGVGTTTTSWKYVSYTGTLTGTQANAYSAGYVYVQALPANAWFEVSGLKIEEGVTATPWSPSFSDFVQKDGDTIKGDMTFDTPAENIYYKGTKNTNSMIRFIDNTVDVYGNGVAIGGGGQAIIGGGESSAYMEANAGNAGAEIMWIGNDTSVEIYTNLQNGWADRKMFDFSSDGGFFVPRCVYIYGSNQTYWGAFTESNETLTANRVYSLPNGSGTLALKGNHVLKTGDTMTGTLNLTNSNISIESVSSEKYVRLVSSSGILLYLDMAASGHGLWSSGYGTSLTDGTTYTPSGSWIIFRDSTGYVRIPKWASTGANGTPVYFDSNGTPVATNPKTLGNHFKPEGGYSTDERIASANVASTDSGGIKTFLATSSMTTGKPAEDGNIIQFEWDNATRYTTQLAIIHGSGRLQHRYQTGTGTSASDWTPWYSVYSEAYKPSWSDIQNKPTIGTVTSVAVTGSKGISVSGSPITSSGTIDVSVSTSSGTATRNTTNTSAGEVKYQKYGRVVTIYTTAQITITSTGAALSKVYFTGLPKPPAMVTFTATGAGNKAVALQITTDGYIQGVYNAPPSGVLTIGTTYIASS